MKKTFVLALALLICSFVLHIPSFQTAQAARFDFTEDYKVLGYDMDGSYVVGAVNIKDHGAVGDGIADDTDAFQSAYDAVVTGPRAGVLFLPAGEYRITQAGFQLLKSLTIMGEGNADAENGKETVIIADFGLSESEPLFKMVNYSTIMNLSIYYKQQDINSVKAFPYTISTIGANACFVTVRNVTLYNSYNGIDTSGGAQHVSNVNGTILNNGILVTGNAEVSEYMDITFNSSYWNGIDGTNTASIAAYTKANATGMTVGYSDDFFAYNVDVDPDEYLRGIHFFLDHDARGAGASGIAYGFTYKLGKTQVSHSDDYDGYTEGWPHMTFLDTIKGVDAYDYSQPKNRYSTKQDIYNVRAYGAKGNGIADDTSAFKSALMDARRNGGGIVFVPSGQYLITDKLEVPVNTELLGEWHGYRTGSPSNIHVKYTGSGEDDYLIGLASGSGVQGLTFYLPDNKPEDYAAPVGDSYGYENGNSYNPTKDKFPTNKLDVTRYPFLIRGKGNSVWVENICITNASNGIDFNTERCDNFVVRGVWGTCMESGLEVGGGSQNGQISCVFFTFGTWWESVARRVDISYYTYENSYGFTFGNCKNIMALSAATFGLHKAIMLINDGGQPENVSLMRALMDMPYGHVCLGLEAGDKISVVGVSSGTHPTPDSGRISTAITVYDTFNGKARLYGQNIWAGCENVMGGDVVLYLEDAQSAETIEHNFSFGNYQTEFEPYEEPSDSSPDGDTPSEKKGCKGSISTSMSAIALLAVATYIIKFRRR